MLTGDQGCGLKLVVLVWLALAVGTGGYRFEELISDQPHASYDPNL